MPAVLRIATFNLENLDDQPDQRPTLAERAAVLRPQLARLRADVLCLQEVHGQLPPGGDPASDRTLAALTTVLAGTRMPNVTWSSPPTCPCSATRST